ncbi:MAG: hypothetical protein ABIH23_33800, partial [bacterium]
MSSDSKTTSSSMADGFLATSVESAEGYQVAQEEAREAEKERMLAGQQRKAMLESLRASIGGKRSPAIDRK